MSCIKKIARHLDNVRLRTKPVVLDYTEYQAVVMNQLSSFFSDIKYFRPKKYTREQLHRFLDNPEQHQSQLREVSHYLYVNSGIYRRAVNYYANMLTLDNVLVPDGKKIKAARFEKELEKVTRYIDNYNIKHEFGKINFSLVLNGGFFGIERTKDNSTMIQYVNPDICKVSSIVDGCLTYAVDCSYFDVDKKRLDLYPEEFKQMYKDYKDSGNKWQEVDHNIAVCFLANPTMNYPIPLLTSSFIDLYDLDDAKGEASLGDRMDNFRLLVQTIPMKKEPKSDKDMVLSAPTVNMFHSKISEALPENIGLVSTPMDVKPIDLDRTKSKDTDNVVRTEGSVFSSSGAGGVLNSRTDNSISLNRSIETDSGVVFTFLRSYERYFRKKLAQVSSYTWKLLFPDLTIYNREKYQDSMLRMSQYGMPKSLLFAACGLSINDVMSLNAFENEHLSLIEGMLPLMSSHTASGDSAEVGRPKKNTEDLTDSGRQAVEDATNETRAK